MIKPNIYCKVSGMVMACVAELNRLGRPYPTIIEIGSADGDGTIRFAGFCERVISIDTMLEGRPDVTGVESPEPDFGRVDAFINRMHGFPVELVVGASLDPKTIKIVRDLLEGALVDILVIDGCHHPFEAVWGDFETYYPFVKKGGFVVFDDLYELEDILPAYERARDEYKMQEFERWRWSRPNTLQECGALIKI